MKTLLERLQRIERVVAASAFGLMTLLVLTDILLREGFKQSFAIGPKLALDFMILGGFLGAAITSGKGTHLKAEVATKLWPESLKPFAATAGELVTATFCAGMAWISFQYVSGSRELGEANVVTGVPIWISQLVIPWTFVSMTVRHLCFTFKAGLRPITTIEDLK